MSFSFSPRRMLSLLTVLAIALVPGAISAEEPDDVDPMRVLVFSQPYGFSHTDAIVSGAEWFMSLETRRPDLYDVQVARDDADIQGLADDGIQAWEWLRPERLDTFDVLVWNNSTGEVPFPAGERDDLRAGVFDFVADGKGIVGMHSAADSNYTWPAFHELIGGQYDGHWYSFGGIEFEPYRLQLNVEDEANPLLSGVSPDYDSHDETYRWQMDLRPDVHVLHSMDNTSIGAQGALYHYQQPITWCRPVREGRSFYTNIGHSGYHYSDVSYTNMMTNALQWTGDRMDADVDCAVGMDPATGVAGSNRIPASTAEVIDADIEVSTYSGGQTAATNITGETIMTFRDVKMSGKTTIDLFAAAHTMSAPSTVQILGGPYNARIRPADGGTIEVRLDSTGGPVVASATLLPTPTVIGTTTLPATLNPAIAVAGSPGSWTTLSADLTPTPGVHDLVVTFIPAPASVSGNVGSLGWLSLS